MSYNNAIPQAGDRPSQSQAQILANFQQIASAFNLNHVDFNASGQGKHDFLQMPENASAPSTAVNEGALYTKEVSSATQLFWRNENNGTEQQLTNPSVSSSGTGGGTSYSIDTIFGIKIKWGSFSSTANIAAITFAGTAFSNTNYAAIGILVSPSVDNQTCVVAQGTQTTTAVSFRTRDTSNQGLYIAIGV